MNFQDHPRRHPDIFTAAEALEYLHLDGGSERTLETLRQGHELASFRIGQTTMYHRLGLDALVNRLAGVNGTAGRPRGRQAGQTAVEQIRSTLHGK